MNLAGQLLNCGSFKADGSGSTFRMDIGGITPGIYVVSAMNRGRLFTEEVVIVP